LNRKGNDETGTAHLTNHHSKLERFFDETNLGFEPSIDRL
jgi:hypothetical protein